MDKLMSETEENPDLSSTEMVVFENTDKRGEETILAAMFPSGQVAVRFDELGHEHLIICDAADEPTRTAPSIVPGLAVRRLDVVDAVEEEPREGVPTHTDTFIKTLRVCFDSERTRVDTEGWLMGWGVQFQPSGQCALYWYRDAYPEEDRLDNPHISLYGSLADVEQGTGGDVEVLNVYPNHD